jgi:hypothetical protein
MDIQKSGALLPELFEEYSEWYLELAAGHGVLPRSISGVSAEGRQFIYLLDSLELHHMARNKYLRFVLDEQRSVAYAYGGIALRGDSDEGRVEEVLDVVAADSKRYIMGNWLVVRGEEGTVAGLKHMGTTTGDDPEKHPASWFLSGSIRFTDPERARYAVIWEQAAGEVTFSERSAEG